MMQTDLLVLGAGAGGLSAALTAGIAGHRVVVAEKSEYLGGTMALSGGGIWIPANPHMAAADSKEAAAGYLRRLLGNRFDAPLVDAFLENGPAMMRLFEENTASVRFFAADFLTDYEPGVEGAAFGRTVSMPHYDAAELGDLFDVLRPPLDQLTVLGGMQVDAGDLDPLIGRWRSWANFRHSARLALRHAADWVRSRRGRVLKSGNGVAARMIRAAADKGVTFLRNAPAHALVERDGRVVGAMIRIDGVPTLVEARLGVVIATGGFAQDEDLRRRFIPYPEDHVSMLPEGNNGDGLRMAEAVGGRLGDPLPNNGCWTPISTHRRADGKVINYPHIFIDRSRPGSILVNAEGERFVNEAGHYQALGERVHAEGAVPCWLVASHGFLRRYGLGLVRPYESTKRYIDDGYLFEAPDIQTLAHRLAIDPRNLKATVDRVNSDARNGQDTQFGRGDSVYDRTYGDPAMEGNANFGPLDRGPYYAIRIMPGDLGTFVGLQTDEHARVLRDGEPVEGLYAAGLDMQSVMGGAYPGAGSMLGPALTFGYIAARHASHAAPAG